MLLQSLSCLIFSHGRFSAFAADLHPAMAAAVRAPMSLIRHHRVATITTLRNPSTSIFQAPSLNSRSKRNMRLFSASVDEEASARTAASSAESGGPTIFDKIISKEIPSSIVYEDDKVLAFRDINPQAPVHIVVIPKIRDGLTELRKAQARHTEILGHLLHSAKIVAEKEGVADGFRVVINSGPSACQSVYHLHLHVLGGRQMKWPPG